MDYKLKQCLDNVRKPARYTGGEYNQVIKDKAGLECRFALCFPELYEIAMSHLGSKILYGRLNAMDKVWCERMHAPAPDMEREMRRVGLPLYGLESKDPASAFDIFGFSLQYELNYTTVLNMLDLAGVPQFSKDRHSLSPLVIAGGPCVYNVEPVVDFFDIILVGEGEENLPALVELYMEAKRQNMDKQSFLEKALEIEGVYVPSFYQVDYKEDGTIAAITPTHGAPAQVKRPSCGTWTKPITRKALSFPPPTWCLTGPWWSCSGAAGGAAGSARRATPTGPSGQKVPRLWPARPNG